MQDLSEADIELLEHAKHAREGAYAPYSKFKVGAALRLSNGSIVTGVNIENASYGATVCAERVAIWKAVSEGHTGLDTIAIFLDSEVPSPCGICRQVMQEFKIKTIIASNPAGKHFKWSLDELLPHSFDGSSLS